MLNSIEKDEQIIKLLEEIDESFSSIKTTLRELRINVGKLSEKNKAIVSNCAPWINFFETESKVEFSPLSELNLNSLKYRDVNNSPSNLNFSTPKNPFVEAESSELLSKSALKKIHCFSASTTSTQIFLEKSSPVQATNKYSQDSDENEIRPFQVDLLPSVFQKEPDLLNIYNFIQQNKTVSLETIITHFKDISHDKLEILISLLCRKNFVKQKDSKITIEK